MIKLDLDSPDRVIDGEPILWSDSGFSNYYQHIMRSGNTKTNPDDFTFLSKIENKTNAKYWYVIHPNNAEKVKGLCRRNREDYS